jgi:hypothetical protein
LCSGGALDGRPLAFNAAPRGATGCPRTGRGPGVADLLLETDHDARIESLAPPIGRTGYPEVLASDYLREKLDAITVS